MESKQEDRRRYSRLELTESTIAVDDSGFQLGHVSQASGGGMMIKAANEEAIRRMPIGARLHITIVEPASGTTNKMNVEVRYIENDSVGMQFV